MRTAISLVVLTACGLALGACTLRGTTESVTDSVQNVTISTSGRTWFTEDGVIRHDQKLAAFVTLNFENLKQNMAQGQGEYLMSLSTLMQIRDDRRADFYALMQSRYPVLIASPTLTPAQLVASLDRELAR